MFYIVMREARPEDVPAISDVVRKAYLSNVYGTWMNALFHEVTFQLIVVTAAIMFIFMGVPLYYCILAVPLVLLAQYILIYGSVLMKSAQVMYEKRPLVCWVAEAYEPLLLSYNPQTCDYKIIPDKEVLGEEIMQRKIIGTVAVMKHLKFEDKAWLFRLAVDTRYRRKGIGLELVQSVKNWCRKNHFNNIELTMSECQVGARQLFAKAGFEAKQIYHKKIVSGVNLQMFHLRCGVRPTFSQMSLY